MKEYKRSDRLADHLHRHLAQLIQQQIRDPGLGVVTLTGIKVSGDLSYADVYLTVLSKNSAAEASTDLAILNKASGFLRSQLMQVIRIRAMPKLRFHYDESVGHGQQMEKLIAQAIDADQQHASRRSSDDHYTDP